MPEIRPHRARLDTRPDGALILTSDWPATPVARCTTDWLAHWAGATPGALFLAERAGPAWREMPYAEAQQRVGAIAAALLGRGLNAATPVMIVSGNGIDHALLSLACQHVGIPVVPVAEQYALIPGAHGVLTQIATLIRPRMVFAQDGARFGAALALPCFDGVERVASLNPPPGATPFDQLDGGADIAAAHAAVGPDTVAKILLTSGSTSAPKGVLTTQRMLTTNQMQLQQLLPFLRARPPRLLDWLPWNHTFGGSFDFNLVLANGGSLHIDDGKPVPGLAERSLENNRLVSGTLAFNVPVGFALLRDAMRADADLRRRFFTDLDMLFYAGASLPQDVWADLESLCLSVRPDLPLFTSAWGLTETAPCALLQHEPARGSGIVGVPMPETEIKLVPTDEAGRLEVRVRGAIVMPGYLNDPDRTAAAFDPEGYFITGDAMRLLDPSDPARGLRFDGRLSEDFKLSSGIWVRAAQLRLDLMVALKGLAADVILTGTDRLQALIVPTPTLREGATEDAGALISPLAPRIAAAFPRGQGSARDVVAALILAEPPQMGEGEMTAKGNLNFRRLLTRRAALLSRLDDPVDPAVIRP
jgi:feruloyl-CoA synthase